MPTTGSTGYASRQTAIVPGSSFTRPLLRVRLSLMPTEWWNAFDAAGANPGRIRVTTSGGVGVELPRDPRPNIVSNGDGTGDGWLVIGWTDGELAVAPTVRIYPDATGTYAAGDTYGQHAVYDANVTACITFDEDPTGADPVFQDRTANGNHLTAEDNWGWQSSYSVAALIGKGADIKLDDGEDEGGDYVSASGLTAADFITASAGTISISLKNYADPGGDASVPYLKPQVFGQLNGFASLSIDSDEVHAYNWDGNADSVAATYTRDQWHRFTWAHGGGTLRLYKDGVEAGNTPSGNTTALTDVPSIASIASIVDELLISNIERSADWIAWEDEQILDNAGFWGGSFTWEPFAIASIDAALPQLAAEASAAVEHAASIDAALPQLSATLSVGVAHSATVDASLPALTASAMATVNQWSAAIDAALPALTAAASVGVEHGVTISAMLPALTAQLDADVHHLFTDIDFETPAWGEFAAPPEGAGGNVTLSQLSPGGMPERGSTALSIALTSGGAGAEYLSIDLEGSEQPLVSVGLYINSSTLSGGTVAFAAGYDDGGVETWRITFDAATRAVTATLTALGGATVSGTLAGGGEISWEHVEFTIDADAAGNVQLWLGGFLVDDHPGDTSALVTRTVRIGCIEKDAATEGVLLLDELTIADAYRGPIRVAPELEHAGDPRRWLVLYNRNDQDSRTWAQWYRDLRGVPYANLVALDLVTTEDITEAQFAADLLNPLLVYIDFNGHDEIAGILVGHGCPGTVDQATSVASRLMAPGDQTPGSANDNYQAGVIDTDDLPERTALFDSLGGRYLVAEINAPDLATAQALSTRADDLVFTDLVGREFSELDPATDRFAAAAAAWAALTAWLGTVQQQQIRLPRNTAFDGTGHADAIEFSDAQDGDFVLPGVGQRRALLVTSGAQTAETVR